MTTKDSSDGIGAGFDKKYGIKITPSKETSWPSVRGKLINGELDAAHVLYGVHLGVSGPKKDMATLMTLNNNGQAITLSKKLADKGAVDGASLAKLMKTSAPREEGEQPQFAVSNYGSSIMEKSWIRSQTSSSKFKTRKWYSIPRRARSTH